MKVNYSKLLEINKESIFTNNQLYEQLSCFWIIQSGVEKYLNNEIISEQHKDLLLELGVLELTEEEKASQTIVGPFNFKNNGSTNP